MRLNRSFGCKAFHTLPILPVYAIIITVIFSFSYFYAFDCFYDYIKLPTSIVFYICAIMTTVCHTLAMIVDPGTVTDKNKKLKFDKTNVIRKLTEDHINGLDKIEASFEKGDLNNPEDTNKIKHPLICFKCLIKRPERSHHCKYCNKCVLKMDHHCPWVANCVGFNNQKHFVLFLFYATVGNFIAFVCLVFEAYEATNNLIYNPIVYAHGKKVNRYDSLFIQFLKVFWEPFMVFIGACLSLAMTLAIGILFKQQIDNILYNSTGIEYYEFNKLEDSPWYFKNSYSLKIRMVMGFESRLHWLIPSFKPNKYNNGISYEVPLEKVKTN